MATDVTNEAKVSGSFMAGFTGRNLYTNVQLWAVVPDNELASLRDALTHNQLQAVRVMLAGDMRVERAVSAKDGLKVMEKFACFYQSLDSKGVDLASAPVPTKQIESAKPATALTIDQIIQLVTAKLSDDIIITTIRNSGSTFDLNADALLKLRSAGVSDAVIRAMTR